MCYWGELELNLNHKTSLSCYSFASFIIPACLHTDQYKLIQLSFNTKEIQLMFSKPENSRLCHQVSHVWETCVSLFTTVLYPNQVDLFFAVFNSSLQALRCSLDLVFLRFPAAFIDLLWTWLMDFCQRAVICCVSGRTADMGCEVLHLFPRCHTWHGSSSISSPKWYNAITMVISNLNYVSNAVLILWRISLSSSFRQEESL